MSLPNRGICARGTEVEKRHMGQVIWKPFKLQSVTFQVKNLRQKQLRAVIVDGSE